MIFSQVFLTAFLLLQWSILYMYLAFTANYVRTVEQSSIINFVYTLTNYCYCLINVKSFYLSILTSRLFRKTFITGLIGIFSRRMRRRLQILQATHSIVTVTNMRHP